MVVPLIGYVDRFSARPGERIAVKVSSQFGEPYRADLVRIIHGDANPAGPGLKFEEVPAAFAGELPLTLPAGTFRLVRHRRRRHAARLARSVHDRRAGAALAARRAPADRAGDRGRADAVGSPPRARSNARRAANAGSPAPMLKRRWYELRIIASDGRLRLRQTALQRSWGVADSGEAEMAGSLGVARHNSRSAPASPPLRGRMTIPTAPSSTAASRTRRSCRSADRGARRSSRTRLECLAWWDFSAEIATDRILDRGPHALHGSCATCRPGRCAARAGPARRPAGGIAPRHYAAIHFHDDDLYDCGWDTDFEVDDPGRHGERRLRRAAALRRRRRTSCRSTCCRRPAPRPRRSPFSPRPSPTRSTATTSAAMPTRRSARARRNGAPIRGTPTRITRNTAPRPTTRTPTAAASAIRACAGRS